MSTIATSKDAYKMYGRNDFNLELNDEEREILNLVRDFAREEVKPRAAEIDATGQYPADLVEKMADLGIMGISLPEEYGGAGQSEPPAAYSKVPSNALSGAGCV